MLATAVLALAMFVIPYPGDTAPADSLGLSPGAEPPAIGAEEPPTGGEVAPSDRPGGPSGPFDPGHPLAFGGAIVAVSAVAAAATTARRRESSRAHPPPNVDVVFVSGHGSRPGGTFGDLIGSIGLAPGQVHEFDWLLAAPEAGTFHDASEEARVGPAADALEGYLAGVSRPGRGIYVVGHSKGGATVAEMVARWDRHPERRVPGVFGAALLDPPMSTGWLGAAQSAGVLYGPMPDDGGYSPMRRRMFGLGRSEDTRAFLGRASSVETMVIRNPDAFFTNFRGHPQGLRVYDLDDGGEHVFATLGDDPIARVGEAHSSVLHHPQVADCILAELHAPGECEWPQDRRPAVFQPSMPRSVGGAAGVGNYVL